MTNIVGTRLLGFILRKSVLDYLMYHKGWA